MYNAIEKKVMLILNKKLFEEDYITEKVYLEVEKNILKMKEKTNEILSS